MATGEVAVCPVSSFDSGYGLVTRKAGNEEHPPFLPAVSPAYAFNSVRFGWGFNGLSRFRIN